MRTLPSLVKAYHGNDGGSGAVSKMWLADMLELDDILIGKQRVNIAEPGTAADYRRIWNGDVAFHYQEPVFDIDNGLTWGFTARYGGWVAGSKNIDPFESGIRGATRVYAGQSTKEIVAAKGAGLLIKNIFAPA